MKIPSPADLLRIAGDGYQAVEQAIGLAPKAGDVVAQALGLVRRAGELLAKADGVLSRADELLDRSDAVLQRIEGSSATAALLVEMLEPPLTSLTPVLETLADSTSPQEVASLVGLVDTLPSVVTAVHHDVLPVLRTLKTVGPDLQDLLVLSRELNEMLGAIPGLGRAKRRFEEEQAEEEAEQG